MIIRIPFGAHQFVGLVGSSNFSPGTQEETEDARWALISFYEKGL